MSTVLQYFICAQQGIFVQNTVVRICLVSRTGGSVAVCGNDVGEVVVIATSTSQLDIRSQQKKKLSHLYYFSVSQYFRSLYRALKIVSEIIL
jgi:hypothetical protein